ncbi:efflux RND transporter periplasmic adaptor subunit [Psychromonas sp. Urea-02u-13]|uniref:efflux RND transporter periplasmic adaptor subunit n=1 Tax=Psychromonas sp. Urea-02u-13 TaxID=2058326 RepID=UPI000C3370AF|nr:efflux RND transporter periplasmic adaptor subunit [Psychromonas sp. Urea-02u-13]PKG38007.1 efflux transporter periplasmic adaptor subunit [Psychromonas sp. Urea-02u-13]
MNITKWLLVIIILAGTIFGLYRYKTSLQETAAAQAASMPEPAAVVTAIEVASLTYQKTIKVSGEVKAYKFLILQNELAGEITRLNAASGQVVKKGQVLVELDHRNEDAQLKSAKAKLMLSQQTIDRNLKLLKHRGISKDKVDAAHAALEIAKADITIIKTAIDKKILVAPFTATVGIHTLEKGQYLGENSEVLELVGINKFTWIDFNLPQLYQELSVGSVVSIRPINQSETYEAKIIAVDPKVSRASRHLKYRAQISSSVLALKLNTLVSVIAPIAEQTTLASVPDLAIKRDALGSYVFVLEAAEEGSYRAKPVPVELGDRQGDAVMILSGVETGQLIANKGSFKLYPGMKVYLTEEATAKATDQVAVSEASTKE